MALKIRLSRGGSKKRPYYKVVIADVRAPRDGRFIEKVGSYNPLLPQDHPQRLVLQEDRIKHWLSVGCLPTDRVARFLGEAGIIEKPATPANQTKKSKPKAKALERLEEKRQKEEEAKAAAAEAAANESAEEPAEEAASA